MLRKDCWLPTINKQIVLKKKKDKENMFYTCQKDIKKRNNMWFIDSGYINHMFDNKDIFLDMDRTIKSQVKMGKRRFGACQGKRHI